MGQHWTPDFSARKLQDGYFLAHEFGEWAYLTDAQYADLSSGQCAPELYQELADKGLIDTPDNSGQRQKARERWVSLTSGNNSQLVIVHLTQRCNLTCGYCHSSAIPVTATGRDLNRERAERAVEFISQIPKTRITLAFQGGEPALELELIDYICSALLADPRNDGKTLRFGITTNGTIQTPAFLNLLRRYEINTTISFDGPKAVHDTHRTYPDGKGSYDEAIKFRDTLRKEVSTNTAGAIMVLTQETLPNLDEIIDQYLEFGQFNLRLKPVTKLGRAKKGWNDSSLDFDEFWGAYKHVHNRLIQRYRDTGKITVEHSVFNFVQKLLERRNIGDVDSRNPCGIIDGVINLDVDGKVHACHEGKRKKDFLLGTTEDGFEAVTTSAKADQIRQMTDLSRISACQRCAYRAYCTPCPAHNHQSFGDGDMRPFESWECQMTLAIGDLVLSDFETNSDYYVNAWREWKMQLNVRDALTETVTG